MNEQAGGGAPKRVVLELDEIRKRRLEAVRTGHQDARRIWEELERRADESGMTYREKRETRELRDAAERALSVLVDEEMTNGEATVEAVDILSDAVERAFENLSL